MPAPKRRSAIAGVIEKPPATFSAFMTVKSICMLLLQVLQTIEQRRATGLTDNIANEQKLHKDVNSKW